MRKSNTFKKKSVNFQRQPLGNLELQYLSLFNTGLAHWARKPSSPAVEQGRITASPKKRKKRDFHFF